MCDRSLYQNPQMTVDIDREKAAIYSITVDQVRNQLTTPSVHQVGTIYMPTSDYQIILEAAAVSRRSVGSVETLCETTNNQLFPPIRWQNWCRRWGRCRSTTRASNRR